MPNNRKTLTIIVLIIICSIFLSGLIGCDKTDPTGSGTSDTPTNSETPSQPGSTIKPLPKTCANVNDGYSDVSLNYFIPDSSEVKNITETITVNNHNGWWFMLGLVGLIPYLVETHEETIPVDVYTTKSYIIRKITNTTLWASVPIYYTGGDTTINIQQDKITTSAIEETLSMHASISLGIDIEFVTSEFEVGVETALTEIQSTAVGQAQGVSESLNGYAPNKYYRYAVKGSYNVIEKRTTNSNGDLVQTSQYIEPDNESIYIRLEWSDSIDFSLDL